MTKPIDVIRKKIDLDLVKYHQTTLCFVRGVRSIKGVGLLLRLTPVIPPIDVEITDNRDPKHEDSPVEFWSVCINRDGKFWDEDLREKYFAITLNIVKDIPYLAPCFLIPKTVVSELDKLEEEELEKITDRSEENIVPKWMG